MFDTVRRRYLDAIVDTNREAALATIHNALEDGSSPEDVVFNIVIPVMEDLAEIVRLGTDATLAQLYLASQISSEISEELIPRFAVKAIIKGKMVIGTAYEDFHGLGKKIVGGCMKSHMIEVLDLGLNVPAEKFVDEAVKHHAGVIGVSSMMVHTARGDNGPRKVRQLIEERGLSERIRLIVGGAPYRFHPDLYLEVGADAWSENGISAVSAVEKLLTEVQQPS